MLFDCRNGDRQRTWSRGRRRLRSACGQKKDASGGKCRGCEPCRKRFSKAHISQQLHLATDRIAREETGKVQDRQTNNLYFILCKYPVFSVSTPPGNSAIQTANDAWQPARIRAMAGMQDARARQQLSAGTLADQRTGRAKDFRSSPCAIRRKPKDQTRLNGGEGGIRTHGRVSPTPAFEAGSFNRSDTSPQPEHKISRASAKDKTTSREKKRPGNKGETRK